MKQLATILILAFAVTALEAQTPTADTSAPPPQPFTWTAPVASSTQLGCPATPTSAACSYRLYRLTGACPTTLPVWPTNPTQPNPTGWTTILTTALSQTNATDSSLAYSTTYAWVVTALNQTGTSQSPASNCWSTTTSAPPNLGPPTGFSGM